MTAPADGGRDRWLAIEMRHLAALATVAHEGSFSDAADRLGYVQSTVSQQIAYLEKIVGRRLVERSGRPRSATLTEAGAVLVDHIEQILEQVRLAKRGLDALAGRSERPMSIGMPASFGSWLLTGLAGAMLGEAGGRPWRRLDPGPSGRLLDAVARDELDAAFVELPIRSGPFFAMELMREPSVLAVPAGAPPCVDAALQRWPLVGIDGCQATRALLERVTARGRQVVSVHTVESPASALPFVRSGVAVAVMTERDVTGDVAGLPLPGVPDRVVGLAWHRDRDECPDIAALRAAVRRAFPRP